MIVAQLRTYYEDFTESTLHIDGGKKYCYVLEDIARPLGVKFPGETCIPEGHYRVAISISSRWHKPMMLLYNTKEKAVERFGVKFTGIRPHGGNRTSDTEGCPILAYRSSHDGKVWNRASDDLFVSIEAAINNEEEVHWIITEKAEV